MGVVSDLVYDISVWFQELPSFPVVFVLLTVLGLPTTVIHEVGHGLVARRLTRGTVDIDIHISGLDWSGVCRVGGHSDTRMGDILLIIAAGPLASLAQGAAATWLAAMAEPGTPVHAVLACFALAGYLAGVLNFVPLIVGTHRSDGQLIVDVVKCMRGGRAADWLVP